MEKIDLIIDALETGLKLTDGFISEWNQINKALDAARELRELTPISQDQYERLCFTCGACTGKPWVGLTDSDIALVLINSGSTTINFVNGIESKLKELNR